MGVLANIFEKNFSTNWLCFPGKEMTTFSFISLFSMGLAIRTNLVCGVESPLVA